MITSIIISNGIKQLMLTPETDADRLALSVFTPNDIITVAVRKGSFASKDYTSGFKTDLCQGGFLRGWESKESVMLVMTPAEKTEKGD